MKKTLTIILMILMVIGCAFAADNKWAVGLNCGMSSAVEKNFKSNLVSSQDGPKMGIGVDLSVDYAITSEYGVTGIVGWQMPDRTYVTETATGDTNQHYIDLFCGFSFPVDLTGDFSGFTWRAAVGPQMVINCNKGKVGMGGGVYLKGSYAVSDNVTLDVVASDVFFGIKDVAGDTKSHIFNNTAVKLGCTYKF